MKIKFLKSILSVLVVSICLSGNLSASHIVGGEIRYECLGNNQYRIFLKVYRDCENGNPGAFFDDPVPLGIFDGQTGNYLRKINILFDPNINDTLSAYYPDSCVIPNHCIHTTTYSTTTSLPFRTGGYVLSYQRCCRAGNIVNISNPNTIGMTIQAEITPEGLTSCNSSPTFNREVPLIIGINDTFSINLGATDVDGNSLIYALYGPFDGATQGNPAPDPPAAPPYISITHSAPYTAQMPFGNSFCIWDSLTGYFSVAPTNLGTYALGFSISEYNSAGVLLGRTYKDVVITTSTIPCSATINVKKIALPSTVQVFPNPTQNKLTIITEEDQNVQFSLYSIQGQLLKTGFFLKETTINLSQYPKGMYIVKIDGKNAQAVKTFIKE